MKPLGRKNYGSIGHLPCSRMGPADHCIDEGQQRICTIKVRDKHDLVIVTEKLDGSNVGIAKVGNNIYALNRVGYLAQSSKYEQHQLFADWVRQKENYWREVLSDGQRLVGEWMAQAHGTRYSLPYGPFAAFDLMVDSKRLSFEILYKLCTKYDIPIPKLVHRGEAISVKQAMKLQGFGDHGADDPEGIVYRVERKGVFDFMAKWVKKDKVDGKYLPDIENAITNAPIWNWRP